MPDAVTTLTVARAICRVRSPGDPECVMDEHPERDPCDAENCLNYRRALAVLEVIRAETR